MRASYTSPLLTVTIGPRAPDITVSPACRGRPTFAMVFASQSVADSGSPRQAAPAADRDFLAAHLHHHAAETQFQAVELLRRSAEHIEAGGGVVGNRVEDADLPVRDARVDDLDRRQRELDRA